MEISKTWEISMKLIVNCIRGVVVSNLIILGLVGCATDPAPWVYTENPNKDHVSCCFTMDESANAASANKEITEPAPVLMASAKVEPMVMQEAEPIVMKKTEMVEPPKEMVPVVVEDDPVIEEQSANDIMAMLSTNYAVQVFAGHSEESIRKFQAEKDLADLLTVKTNRSGKIIYVLVDVYTDKKQAHAAAANLEIIIGDTPWVRSMKGLQAITVQ